MTIVKAQPQKKTLISAHLLTLLSICSTYADLKDMASINMSKSRRKTPRGSRTVRHASKYAINQQRCDPRIGTRKDARQESRKGSFSLSQSDRYIAPRQHGVSPDSPPRVSFGNNKRLHPGKTCHKVSGMYFDMLYRFTELINGSNWSHLLTPSYQRTINNTMFISTSTMVFARAKLYLYFGTTEHTSMLTA